MIRTPNEKEMAQIEAAPKKVRIRASTRYEAVYELLLAGVLLARGTKMEIEEMAASMGLTKNYDNAAHKKRQMSPPTDKNKDSYTRIRMRARDKTRERMQQHASNRWI